MIWLRRRISGRNIIDYGIELVNTERSLVFLWRHPLGQGRENARQFLKGCSDIAAELNAKFAKPIICRR